ncbi:MAG: SusC/RagA family TonB-linked outer membrane protein [Marinifilaceae bacterium]
MKNFAKYFAWNQSVQMKSISWMSRLCLVTCLTATLPIAANATQIESNSSIQQNQEKTITGKVTDKNGETLIGVNIIVKGTTNGATTDFDGNYTINAPKGSTLVFTYIGYLNQEVVVADQSAINITLKEDVQGLDEVVVVGYGVQKKSDLSGSVSTVKVDDIQKVKAPNAIQTLQGQVPGVNITSASGSPDASIVVQIRGIGTLNNNDPLYIIDGVPGDMSYLNADDIESLSVLKDGAAAAIYGSRAANGVIIIKTKRGSKNKEPEFSFSADYSLSEIANKWEMTNAEEFIGIYGKIRQMKIDAEDGIDFGQFYKNYTSGTEKYADTDWQDEMFRTALTHKYNLRVSGGNDKANFSVSGTYQNQEGTIIASDLEKYGLRLNSDYKKGRIKIGESVSINRKVGNSLRTTGYGTNYDMLYCLPLISVYDENNLGGFGGSKDEMGNVKNPVGNAKLPKIEYTEDYITADAYAQIDIIEGLSYKINGGLHTSNYYYNSFTPKFRMSSQDYKDKSYLYEFHSRSRKWILENTLNFNKKLGKHSIGALAGYTAEQNKYKKFSASGKDFISDETPVLDQAQSEYNVSGSEYTSELLSYLGRFTYNFDDKYYLTGTFRRDGSSRFGSNNRYGNFPSASVGYRISKEEFFPFTDIINDLKIRASWGKLGNQEIPNYMYQNTLAKGYPYMYAGKTEPNFGVISTSFPNDDIKWETTISRNIGVDFQILDSKIGFTAEYFNNKTEDMLVNVPIPMSFGGYNSILKNAGEMENKGLEFSLSYRKHEGEFNYSVTANLSATKNKVLSLGSSDEAIEGGYLGYNTESTTKTKVGGSVADFYLYQMDGIFQSDAEAKAYQKDGEMIQPNAQAGDIRFKDVNNDGKIDNDDKIFSGSSLPDFEYGLNFNASYKNFDLSMYIHGVYGNKIFNGVKYNTESCMGYRNYSKTTLNAWSEKNKNNSVPRLTYNDPNQNSRVSSRFLEDGSFIRLKNIQIGYTIPKEKLEGLGISFCRFYASANNLFTITDYSGYDPEIGGEDPNNDGDELYWRGVDNGVYPQARTFNFGVQLNF